MGPKEAGKGGAGGSDEVCLAGWAASVSLALFCGLS